MICSNSISHLGTYGFNTLDIYTFICLYWIIALIFSTCIIFPMLRMKWIGPVIKLGLQKHSSHLVNVAGNMLIAYDYLLNYFAFRILVSICNLCDYSFVQTTIILPRDPAVLFLHSTGEFKIMVSHTFILYHLQDQEAQTGPQDYFSSFEWVIWKLLAFQLVDWLINTCMFFAGIDDIKFGPIWMIFFAVWSTKLAVLRSGIVG